MRATDITTSTSATTPSSTTISTNRYPNQNTVAPNTPAISVEVSSTNAQRATQRTVHDTSTKVVDT